MIKVFIKRFVMFCFCTIVGLYLLFLLLPVIATPILSKYSEQISKMAEESCGLKIKIEKLQIVTTPKLTVGVRIGHFSAALPNGEEFVSAINPQAKLSLVPLANKKLEVDVFSIDDIDATLKIKPDGNLEIIDYLPESKDKENKEQLTSLPWGLKLSNRLPNIYIREYMLTMVDMRDRKEYTVQGGNLTVTDFVLDKNVKFSTVGIAKLDGTQYFSYDIKVHNKIMPDLNLNDLVFAPSNNQNDEMQEKKTPEEKFTFNFIDIVKSIKANGLTADATLNIETSGKPDDIHIIGVIDIKKLSMLVNGVKLPDGHMLFKFKGKKAVADIGLYTAKDELTTIVGEIIHDKNPKIDLKVNSKAAINNIFNVLKSVANSVNYHDIDTLSATGNIDANFSINSDMKKVLSSGYLRIPNASVKYALYNILIDKINADINLENNNVNIKNIGFTILSQPLKVFGKISDTAVADVHITADKLLIKGLLAAAGQVGLLKDNDIKSGTLSADAVIKGALTDIKPVIDIDINNVNLKNKPSDTTVKLNDAKVKLSVDGNVYKGDIDAKNLNLLNPAASVVLPKLKVNLDTKDINISDTYLMFDNSRFDITGKVTDYTTKNMNIKVKAKGALLAKDLIPLIPIEMRSMFTAKGSMPVLVLVSGNDKKQNVDVQLLATPSGYLKVTELQSLSGKSLLLNSNIGIAGNSVTLNNTGAYALAKNTLSDAPASNIGGTQLVKVTGGVDISKMLFSNLNVSTVSAQTFSVPSYVGSKVSAEANVTLNGDVMNPKMKGNIKCPSVSLPAMKTTLKDIVVDLGDSIIVNLPTINVADSVMSAKAVVSNNFSNGVIINNLDFNSSFFNSDSMISAMAAMPTSSANNSSSSDLGVIIQNGKGNISKFKSGKIIATNLTSDFNLKNNIFTLKNLTGEAFGGKFAGVISVNVLKGNTNVDMTASGMKAVDAIAATAGINNALSGTLAFDAKLVLNAFAPEFNDMLKSVSGTANFEIKDGTYMNIGTIDQLVLANNVLSNAVLKAALGQIKALPAVKNSSKFSDICGKISLKNGVATLTPVKSAGISVAYYVTGDYNLINGYTNVSILGRMGADLVKALGPLGDLSVTKLSAYLPKFGQNTLLLLNALTSNPKAENTALIPKLTGDIQNAKDFKVLFNGNIMSPASVKNFKWLSTCDTSEITTGTLVDQVKNSVTETQKNIQSNIDTAKQQAEAARQQAEAAKQQLQDDIKAAKQQAQEAKAGAKAAVEDAKAQYQNAKDAINDLKNLFKSPTTEKPASSSAPADAKTGDKSAQPAEVKTTESSSANTTSKPAEPENTAAKTDTSSTTSAGAPESSAGSSEE